MTPFAAHTGAALPAPGRRDWVRPAWLAASALLTAVATAGPTGLARAANPSPAAVPPMAPAAAVPAEPGQTMASFGDWVVRCEQTSAQASNGQAEASSSASNPSLPKRVCEVAQALVIKGQQAPVAQIAFGRMPPDGKAAGDASLTLTVLLPVNISFSKPPRLAGADDKDGATLAMRRCLPGGCLADAKPGEDLLKALRAPPDAAKPGHLSFTDAAERTLTLPFSTRGLVQALDDLARETARDGGKDAGKSKG